MKRYFENLAKALLGMKFNELNSVEQKVIESIANQQTVAENVNTTFHEQLTFGQRLADRVAAFGGSWPFICLFMLIMLGWITINVIWWGEAPFDPYPFILLNLILSTLAAIQAPIIMMSQNRQAAKDRLEVVANYEVSLKTDLEIMRLHSKLDALTQSLNELKGLPPQAEQFTPNEK